MFMYVMRCCLFVCYLLVVLLLYVSFLFDVVFDCMLVYVFALCYRLLCACVLCVCYFSCSCYVMLASSVAFLLRR